MAQSAMRHPFMSMDGSRTMTNWRWTKSSFKNNGKWSWMSTIRQLPSYIANN